MFCDSQILETRSPIQLCSFFSTNITIFCSFQKAIDYARAEQFDHFLAVGGGSVIDTAKAANLYLCHPENELLDFVNAPIGEGLPIRRALKPLIAGMVLFQNLSLLNSKTFILFTISNIDDNWLSKNSFSISWVCSINFNYFQLILIIFILLLVPTTAGTGIFFLIFKNSS